MIDTALFQVITAAFFALNGSILYTIWSEIRGLRRDRHAHSNILAQHTLRLGLLDGMEDQK